jgi:4-amino-4-deoxychorismate lyase
MLAVLVNGTKPADTSAAIAVDDRGFTYGDGVFETALLCEGRVRFLDDHLQRLGIGCERLGITAPARTLLEGDIATVCAGRREAVLKLIVTRGPGTRGYRPSSEAAATRVVTLHAPPQASAYVGIHVRWCDTRLGRNPQLAGIKHLNRLEQVLAQAEWNDPTIEEGLMLDTEGELVCATASNLFLVCDGELVTHDLRFCGVRGVIRAQVLKQASLTGVPARERPLWPHDLEGASEVFVTNAIRGLRPVVRLGDRAWRPGPVCDSLGRALG